MKCPHCGSENPDDNTFCEDCGKKLAAAAGDEAGCPSCGAGAEEIDEDGFCQCCGIRARRPASDHLEVVVSDDFAGVTDRGLKHPHNEDRFAALAAAESFTLVACDGVSSSRQADLASTAAAKAASEWLVKAASNGTADYQKALRDAIGAARDSISMLAGQGGAEPPSTTIVAALVKNGKATLGWLGDSRAYWIDTAGAKQLTDDHSWLNFIVCSGQLTREQAEKSPHAHAITRWLGADSGENDIPDVVEFPIPGHGLLMLCTDGLWNYVEDPAAMAALIGEAEQKDKTAAGIARQLIEFAKSKGGHDNITAVLLRCGGTEPAEGS